MLTWSIVLCIFILTSLLFDLGILHLAFLIPPWNEIILDIVLLFIVLGILYRSATMNRMGEKEKMRETIKKLLKEIKELRGESEEEKFAPPSEKPEV